MIRFILLALFAFSAHASPGGDLTGNGGHGVICGFAPITKNNVYLLDTFELLDERAYISNISFEDAKRFFIARLGVEFSQGHFEEIYEKIEKEGVMIDDPSFSRLAPPVTGDFGLVDPFLTLGDFEGCRLVQIVVYVNDRAFINRVLFNALSSFNQAALFAHEALYYLYRQKNGIQNSMLVRSRIQTVLINQKLHRSEL